MPLSAITSADPVHRAIREFDAIGREAFLAKYGFGPSTRYLVDVGGRLYDSKALLGAAHQWASPEGRPPGPEDFSGGANHAVRVPRASGLSSGGWATAGAIRISPRRRTC
jgi:5-methylcytosine-specific restriction enzyme A